MKKIIFTTSLFALFAGSIFADANNITYTPTTSWKPQSTDVEGSYTIDATNTQYGSDTILSVLDPNVSAAKGNFDSDGQKLINNNFNAITVSTGENTNIGSLVLSSNKPATVYGNITYNINGGKVRMGVLSEAINEVVVGTYGTSDSVVWGNTQINMTSGEVGATILGAGSGTTKGNTTINISGGTVYGRGANVLYDTKSNYDRGARGIYGGGSWGSVVEGDTYVNISGGSIQTNVFGGAYSNNTINGNTNVVISGDAEILGDVSGGSFDYKVRSTPNVPVVKGNVNVTISGGTIRKITASDGYNMDYVPVSSGSVYGATGTVEGNVNVNISGGSIEGNVYGAGNATTTTTVAGDINVTLSKNAVVGGSIYGSDGNATVKGIKTFSVKEYVGSIRVNNFDKIEISADSNVVFLETFDVDTLVVEIPQEMLLSTDTDAQVSLADGTTFDTLTLVGDFEQNQINLNTVFGDSAGVVLSALEDKNTALTVIDSNGQEWATENLSSENGILSFEKGAAIPEPSTYAIIFGALALGFVAYRRRK